MSFKQGLSEKTFKRWQFWMKIGNKMGCHQMCERSFKYKGMQFFLCARCTGLLIGHLIIAPPILLLNFNNLYLNIALILLMAIDGFIQYFGLLMSTNLRRFITGLGAGYGLTSLIVYCFIQLFNLIS
jgi:uncharacterized membrane protein